LPIDLTEITNITKDLVEINGQVTRFQQEIAKPIKRIRMISMSKDQFGDEITDADRVKLFAKAKLEYEKCIEVCTKSIRDLPKMKRELEG